MLSSSTTHRVVAILTVRWNHQQRAVELHAGDRLFLGSDERADVCIQAADVAPTHCVISASQECLQIEDCYSPAGTFVDGRRIRRQALQQNTEICIGTAVLRVRLFTNAAENAADMSDAEEPPDPESLSGECRETRNATGDTAAHETMNQRTIQPASGQPNSASASSDPLAELQWKLIQLQEENHTLTKRLESVSQTSIEGADNQRMAAEQQEMLELLRGEVLDLQAQLSRQLMVESGAHPANCVGDPCTDPAEPQDCLSPEESQRLLQRLEQLLTELQQRDEHVEMLSELLDASEQAQRMEREERGQLDGWLKDIELRFGTREQEWQSERDELKRTIATIIAERNQAVASLNCSTTEGRLEAAHNLLQALRDTADQQRRQLEESSRTILDLQGKLEQSQELRPREERVELATLRAEIARLKRELETVRLQSSRTPLDDSNLKLQALRLHLKDIHDVEMAQRAEREEKKLSHRLAKLWQRLECR